MGVFDVSSITSMAFPFTVYHNCTKLKILTQPKSNYGSPVSMGTYFSGFRIKALDSKGKGIPDLPLIFLIDQYSNGN